MFDLHRHDEFSQFDGFGTALDVAAYAKELGHTAICTTNHGNTSGLVRTYEAGHTVGIKPILGVEGYFLPVWKEKTRGYHLTLLAKDFEGYGNLNRIQYEGDKHRYYNPIWDFELLARYHKGVICSTACIASYTSRAIAQGRPKLAEKALVKLRDIFGDDLYVEIQPYKISDEGMQEKVNVGLMKLARKLDLKCILTSDSHRVRPDDFSTYLKMHEIAKHDLDMVRGTYEERYMPSQDDIVLRFVDMHADDVGGRRNALRLAGTMIHNLEEIERKCDGDYLDDLPHDLPKLGTDSTKELRRRVRDGLKRRGKLTKPYIRRCKEELAVIEHHGFEDYFLIVSDYVVWAKENGIAVGPGRGSVCNSLVAYALYITEVDSLHFGLEFRRFLHMDKEAYPDIDLDFEAARRGEVLDYIVHRYEGHGARIVSYGLYKVDNLINDLVKVCGYWIEDDDTGKQVPDKEGIAELKRFVKQCVHGNDIDTEMMLNSPMGKAINEEHDNILVHFSKLYTQVRFIGTHAAGVAISGGSLLDYTAMRADKNGDLYCSYDLSDLEKLNVVKFDVLGLRTMDIIRELREVTGDSPSYEEMTEDPEVLERFNAGETEGIFQFESRGAMDLLREIGVDSFGDVVAASAMNRPGPLSMGQHTQYAQNKANQEEASQSPFYRFTEETYGTIVYQEQMMRICFEVGKFTNVETDKFLKLMKQKLDSKVGSELEMQRLEHDKDKLKRKFVDNAVKQGYNKAESAQLFENMISYSFNQGHGTGYSLISVEGMYYKVHHPNAFWYVNLKYARNEDEYGRFSALAVGDGSVIWLPHVNYSGAMHSLRKVDGELTIQEGLTRIKGVGAKAATCIEVERRKNGIFKSYDDFYDRCVGNGVNKGVLAKLEEMGAVNFNKRQYVAKTTHYNSALYSRYLRMQNGR